MSTITKRHESRVVSSSGSRISVSRSNNTARQALCRKLFESIMTSLFIQAKPRSDQLTETYKRACTESKCPNRVEKQIYALSILPAFRTGLAKALDDIVDRYNHKVSEWQGVAAGDHASITGLTFDGKFAPEFEFTEDGAEISVSLIIMGGSDTRCTVCSSDADDCTVRYQTEATVRMKRNGNKWDVWCDAMDDSFTWQSDDDIWSEDD